MDTKRKSLAIITARGGSKRIPRKNIKEFCGKPIIIYSIEAAIQSGMFEEVMVSTDDQEIAEIAEKAGAKVPFFRSEDTSNDYASTDDVITEVIQRYMELGKSFDSFCFIYPTAPFLGANRIKMAMDMLEQYDSVMPVVAFSYPPHRGLIIEDGMVHRKYPEFATTRSQDLQMIYHDCGQFYACKTKEFLEAGTTDLECLAPIILTEMEVQDIDTIEDWKIAEIKYRLLHNID